MRVLELQWASKPETASRVRGRIEGVLAWATVRGFRHGPNPAVWRGHLAQLLPKRSKVRPMAERAAAHARRAALVLLALFIAGGIYAGLGVEGYRITSDLSYDGPSNPLLKTVTRASGVWLSNYNTFPWMLLAPALVFVGTTMTNAFPRARQDGFALIASGVAVAGVIATAGLSTFPFLLPSLLDPDASLTVWDAYDGLCRGK
jgi:cytochrome d oxidase subunit CydB